MTQRTSLTTQAHQFILQSLNTDDIAIDATVGNGHDTLFLARHVGEKGHIFGFDIQKQAIESTQTRLSNHLNYKNNTLFNASHENLVEYIPSNNHGKIKAMMFNLGYLPRSDKTVITQVNSTLNALNQAIEILMIAGVITITAYPGHSGGKEETLQIKRWCDQLDSNDFKVTQINSSEKATSPILFVILKS